MTKDLSRQLCELAGIEAKHLFSDISDNFEDGFTAFSDILEADLSNGSWMQITKEPVYPNFKLPENFVKLLECLYKNSIQVSFINRYGQVQVGIGGGNFLDEACIDFINILSRKDDLDSQNLLNELKQALQIKDWRY